ncbi:MAG: PmoA family protein [Eubacteriales bacterium]
MNITLKTRRALYGEPIFAACEAPDGVCGAAAADGRIFPAQNTRGGVIIIASLPAESETELTLSCRPAGSAAQIVTHGTSLDIMLGGKRFSSYVWDERFAKPYFGAVMTESGDSFTRLDFETPEHPHHRSVFLGVGDVTLAGSDAKNVDFWNEPENRGVQRQRSVGGFEAGQAFARFRAENVWRSASGIAMLDESRTFTVYNQSAGCRYVDIDFTFTASYGEVVFGATKEAGPLGIRVNDALRADRGGHMTNSYGASGESECWGRPAHWCDYSGTLGGREAGITVFDNPQNERYPTTWHIRDYGLFAANNLYFRGGLTIAQGNELNYRYRIIFREGKMENITDRFINYIGG